MARLSNILKLYICCHLLFLQVTEIISKVIIEPRIVGGRNATIGEVPFLVQIWTQEGFACGGTLASYRHVVTVAHCVYHYPPECYTVVAGVSAIGEFGVRQNAFNIIIHPEYRKKEHEMDIAVVILKSPLWGPSIGLPIKCTIPIQAGDNVQLYGWGKTSETYYYLPSQLQTAAVAVIDQYQCKSTYQDKAVIMESMFCAGWHGRDACNGDSGGPALIRGQFCGIITWGVSCDNQKYPGVYTRVNHAEVDRFLSYVLRTY